MRSIDDQMDEIAKRRRNSSAVSSPSRVSNEDFMKTLPKMSGMLWADMSRVKIATTVGVAFGALTDLLLVMGGFYNILSIINAPLWYPYYHLLKIPGTFIDALVLPLIQWGSFGYFVGVAWTYTVDRKRRSATLQ